MRAVIQSVLCAVLLGGVALPASANPPIRLYTLFGIEKNEATGETISQFSMGGECRHTSSTRLTCEFIEISNTPKALRSTRCTIQRWSQDFVFASETSSHSVWDGVARSSRSSERTRLMMEKNTPMSRRFYYTTRDVVAGTPIVANASTFGYPFDQYNRPPVFRCSGLFLFIM